MKILLFVLLGLLSFAGTLVALLAVTGGLNSDTLGRLTGAAPPEVAVPAARPVDTLGPLAQQLKDKEAKLAERESSLNAREQQLLLREQELDSLRSQLESLQADLLGTVEESEKARQEKLAAVATTLTEMKPDKAAQSLNGFPPEDQAAILNLVAKAKDRGKILEAMDQEQAQRVLQAMQDPIL